MFKSTKKQGFTLIELLVVVAIIAALLSILSPALRKAKESARSAICLTNQRTISLAWIAYAANNSDKLVGADTGYRAEDWIALTGKPGMYNANFDFVWPGTMEELALERERAIKDGKLWSYMSDLKAYKCPSHINRPTADQLKRHPRVPKDEYKYSYVIVGTLNGYAVWQTGKLQVFTRMAQIKHPSTKLTLTEQHDPRGVNQGSWAWQYTLADVQQSSVIMNQEPLQLWHNNGQSWAFGDGHGEVKKWENPTTIEVAKKGLLYQTTWQGTGNEDAYWIAKGMPGATR